MPTFTPQLVTVPTCHCLKGLNDTGCTFLPRLGTPGVIGTHTAQTEGSPAPAAQATYPGSRRVWMGQGTLHIWR